MCVCTYFTSDVLPFTCKTAILQHLAPYSELNSLLSGLIETTSYMWAKTSLTQTLCPHRITHRTASYSDMLFELHGVHSSVPDRMPYQLPYSHTSGSHYITLKSPMVRVIAHSGSGVSLGIPHPTLLSEPKLLRRH